MTFQEKKEHQRKLASAEHLEADKALLASKDPKNRLLRAIGTGVAIDNQLLWVLFDHASPAEIEANREAFVSKSNPRGKKKGVAASSEAAPSKKKSRSAPNKGGGVPED